MKNSLLSIFFLIGVYGCTKYAEPILEPNDSWPNEFNYDVMQHNFINGCINIAGIYEPVSKRYSLENGNLTLVEEDVMNLSSLFDVSKPAQSEIEIKVSEPEATVKPYYIVQSEEDMKVAFYRFDGSKKYVSSLKKNTHYSCVADSIILRKRYSRYGAEGTFINYKTYIEVKQLEDGLIVYENIANTKGNKHY